MYRELPRARARQCDNNQLTPVRCEGWEWFCSVLIVFSLEQPCPPQNSDINTTFYLYPAQPRGVRIPSCRDSMRKILTHHLVFTWKLSGSRETIIDIERLLFLEAIDNSYKSLFTNCFKTFDRNNFWKVSMTNSTVKNRLFVLSSEMNFPHPLPSASTSTNKQDNHQ